MPKSFQIILNVKANAKKNTILPTENAYEFKVSIKAPREKNKANDALIDFFSELLNIPKNQIDIVKGKTAKKKLVKIIGVSFEEFLRKLPSS